MSSIRCMAVPFQGIVPQKCEKLNVSQHIRYLKGVKNLLGSSLQNRKYSATFQVLFSKMQATSLPPTPPGKTTFNLEPW